MLRLIYWNICGQTITFSSSLYLTKHIHILEPQDKTKSLQEGLLKKLSLIIYERVTVSFLEVTNSWQGANSYQKLADFCIFKRQL